MLYNIPFILHAELETIFSITKKSFLAPSRVCYCILLMYLNANLNISLIFLIWKSEFPLKLCCIPLHFIYSGSMIHSYGILLVLATIYTILCICNVCIWYEAQRRVPTRAWTVQRPSWKEMLRNCSHFFHDGCCTVHACDGTRRCALILFNHCICSICMYTISRNTMRKM